MLECVWLWEWVGCGQKIKKLFFYLFFFSETNTHTQVRGKLKNSKVLLLSKKVKNLPLKKIYTHTKHKILFFHI